ncbi:member of the karyopherin-beta [Vermiconidia calcicola]|uniref:Member of the karyopherin-beta n=1 Tax=Vermiconidia calcicola TaxID=1690605 RepID=A0ACC3NE58_9PEZI|nr:member of the karyopherin-beta [Vermiconidia calcicola]
MDNGTAIAAPQSVAEVEQLIQRLYKPGPASLVKNINDQLLQLQLSHDGWKLADELMASEDANVRFFAALTFTVKLNNDGPTLDDDTAHSVHTRLISWLVRLVQRGEGGLVCKKLCSTLTTYFLRSPLMWKHPLLDLALSFHHGDATVEGNTPRSADEISDILPNLNELQLRVLLWFAGALAEEVSRVPANTPAHANLHTQMENIVKDASVLMQWAFQQQSTGSASAVRAEALRTYLTWINYAQPVWPRNPEALQYLRDLINQASQCLFDRDLSSEALDIFRDILESYTTFFQAPHMEMLAAIIHNHIRPKLQHTLSEQDPDGLPLAQLVIAFGCANIQQVVEQPDSESGSWTIVELLFDILQAQGYPGDEDQLSIQTIEFWNTYIEYVNDTLFTDSDAPDPSWLYQAKDVLKQVVELLWKKVWTPPNEVAKAWGDSESEGFKEFRGDSTDLMLSIYVLLGKDMLQQLVTLALRSLEAEQWRGVEAALFCLNTLSDNVLEESSSEDVVEEIFRSSLFRDVADFSQNIPSQARRTAIDMLGSYGQYIERHAEFLPDTVRFLFASLEMAGLANAAAKSIASLCSACRVSLTTELPGFLSQYQRFLESKTCDPYTKEKVIGAIAAIIQALSPESAKAEPLRALLVNIEKDVESARQYAAEGDLEMAEVMGVTSLESLASIGKGLQVPEDVPIDIYDDNEEQAKKPSYWESAEGREAQQQIVGCFSVLQVVGTYSAAIDAACQVLRTGLTESEPGPFVLPTSVTVNFVQRCSINTPQLETVLSTAGMMITQHSRKDSKRIDEDVRSISKAVAGFCEALRQPDTDPTVAAECINVLSELMPHYVHVLFEEMSASTLAFILSAVQGPDSMPKRTACEFWTKLIKPQTAAISEDAQQRINQVMSSYGQQLVYSLLHQIRGQAQRSELDYVCEPLKALLLHQSGTQTWLQSALADERFAIPRVTMNDRAMFLRQIMGSRSDGRKTKELVKAFWAACRGTVVSYG